MKKTKSDCVHATCKNPHKALGYCRSHYSQLRRGRGLSDISPKGTREEAFKAKVRTSSKSSCIIWIGALQGKKGQYGAFWDGNRLVGAHQFAFKLANGHYPPEGMEVDHSCRNTLCVNAFHLTLQTSSGNKENLRTTGRNGSSQYRGVDWFPRTRKWRARASSRGVVFNLGYFDTELEAANAALRKRLELLSNNIEDRKAGVLT